MPADRYYYPDSFILDEEITLSDAESHHMMNVMRVQKGDEVEIVNGRGELATGVVEKATKKEGHIRIKKVEKTPPPLPLLLGVALMQGNRLEFLLEKGTELGITHLWCFPGERSKQKAYSSSQEKRWRKILIAAMKQCGRLYLPEWKMCPPIEEWKKIPLPSFFGDISPDAPLFSSVWEKSPQKNRGSLFFIGPEAGFSPHEEEILRSLGAQGVRLHSDILRSETAGIMAVSLLSHWQLF